MTSFPHIAVINGVWLQRSALVQTIEWARARMATATPWERKFLAQEIEKIEKALKEPPPSI